MYRYDPRVRNREPQYEGVVGGGRMRYSGGRRVSGILISDTEELKHRLKLTEQEAKACGLKN